MRVCTDLPGANLQRKFTTRDVDDLQYSRHQVQRNLIVTKIRAALMQATWRILESELQDPHGGGSARMGTSVQ